MDTRSWIKNAAKSTAFSSKEILKSSVPNISSTATSVYDAGKDMYDFVRNAKTSLTRQSDAIDRSKLGTKAKEIFKEAMNDIKTGNFSIEKASNESSDFQSFDFNTDFDSLDGELEAGFSSEGDESSKSKAIIRNNIYVDNTATLKGMQAMTQTIANTNIRATRAANMQTLNALNIGFGKTNYELLRVNKNLENINAKLDAMIDFNNRNVSVVNQSMLQYFDQSLDMMKSMNKMSEISKKAPKYRNVDDIFSGGFNMSEYKKNIKSNIDNSPLGMISLLKPMVEMMTSMGGMMGPPRLAKMGFEALLKQAIIPKKTRKSLDKLDNNFEQYIKTSLLRLGDYGQENPDSLKGFVAQILGVNPSKFNKDLKLGDFKKGAMTWNGIAQKTLVEVIPEYLSNIDKNLEKLAGNANAEARRYDMTSGKMMRESELISSLEEKFDSRAVMDFMSSIQTLNKFAKDNNISDAARQKMLNSLDIYAKTRVNSKRNTDKNLQKNMNMIFGHYLTPKQIMELAPMIDQDVGRNRANRRTLGDNIIYDPSNSAYRMLLASGKVDYKDIYEKRRNLSNEKFDAKTGKKYSDMDEFDIKRLESAREMEEKIENDGIYKTIQDVVSKYLKINLPDIKVKGKSDSLRSRYDTKFSNAIEYVDEKLYDATYGGGSKKTKTDKDTDSFDQISNELIGNVDKTSLNNVTKMKQHNIEKDAAKAAQLMKTENAKNEQKAAKKRGKGASARNRRRRAHSKNKAAMPSSDEDAAAASLGGVEEKLDGVTEAIIDGQTLQTKQNYALFQSFFKPLTNALFGENGLIKKFFVNDLTKAVADKATKFLFGIKNENRQYEDGIFSGVANKFLDAADYMKYVFSGKGYTTRDGKKTYADSDDEDSVIGNLRKSFKSIYENAAKYLGFDIKKKDSSTPEATIAAGTESSVDKIAEATTKAAEEIESAGETVKGAILGEENVDESDKSFFNKFKNKFNKIAPKAIAAGVLGAGAVALSGGSMGLMGLFLPDSLIGGAIVGVGASILSGSESFKKFMFGEKDETGKRTGGALSVKMQENLKKALPVAIGAGAVGAIKHVVTPNSGGFLLGTLLPGSILGGALLGVATSLITRSESFQKFVFGKEDEDGTKQGGLLSKAHNKASSALTTAMPYLKSGAKGAGIGALTAGVIGQMGVLGAALTPGGMIGGALVGLGLGIASQSDKFKDWFFGKEDEKTGEKDGVLPRFQNFLKLEVFEPAGDAVKNTVEDLAHWTREKVMYPFQLAFGPILDALGSVKMSIEDVVQSAFDKITDGVTSLVKSTLDPIKKIVFEKMLKPVGKAALNTAAIGVKMAGTVAASPIQLLSLMMAPQRHKVMKDFNQQYRDDRMKESEEKWDREGTGVLGRTFDSIRNLASPFVDSVINKERYAQAGERFGASHSYERRRYNKKTRQWENEEVALNKLGWFTAKTSKGLRDKQWKSRKKEMENEKKINALRRQYAREDNHLKRELTPAEKNKRAKAFAKLGVQINPDKVTDFIYNRDEFNIGTGDLLENTKIRNTINKFKEEDKGEEKELTEDQVAARRNAILASDTSVSSDMLGTSQDINDYIYRNTEWKQKQTTSATIAGREAEERKKKDEQYKFKVQEGIENTTDHLAGLRNTISEGFSSLIQILSGGKIKTKTKKVKKGARQNNKEVDEFKVNITKNDADKVNTSTEEIGKQTKDAILKASEEEKEKEKAEKNKDAATGGKGILGKAKALLSGESNDESSSGIGGILSKVLGVGSTLLKSPMLAGMAIIGGTLLGGVITRVADTIGKVLVEYVPKLIVGGIELIKNTAISIKDKAVDIYNQAAGLAEDKLGSRTIIDPETGEKTLVTNARIAEDLGNVYLRGGAKAVKATAGIAKAGFNTVKAAGSSALWLAKGTAKVATAPVRLAGKTVAAIGKGASTVAEGAAHGTILQNGAKSIKKIVTKISDIFIDVFKPNPELAASLPNVKKLFTDIGEKATKSKEILAKVGGKAMNVLKGLNIAYTAYAAISGLMASEAANLFHVDEDRVDWLMRIISSAFKTIRSSLIGSIFDIFLEIAEMVMGNGTDIQSTLATMLYDIMSAVIGAGDSEALKLAQEDFTREYENYKAATGNESLSKNAYNDLKNQTAWQKLKNVIFGKDKQDLSQYEVNTTVSASIPASTSGRTTGTLVFGNGSLGYGAVGFADDTTGNYSIKSTGEFVPAREASRAFNSAISSLSRSGNVLLTGLGSIFAGLLGANVGSNTVSSMMSAVSSYINNMSKESSSYGEEKNLGYGTYSQYDPRWKNYRIGTMPDGSPSTMATGGCGPTALATAASAMGTNVSPIQVAQMAKENNYITQGGSSSALFESGASKLGLKPNKISSGSIISNLKSGRPVVMSGKSSKSGPYSSVGHIVTATGIDKNNNVIINDPRKSHAEKYPLSKLSAGMTNAWAYSKGSKSVGFGNRINSIGYGLLNDIGFAQGGVSSFKVNNIEISSTIAKKILTGKTKYAIGRGSHVDAEALLKSLFDIPTPEKIASGEVLTDKQVCEIYYQYLLKRRVWGNKVTTGIYNAMVNRAEYISKNATDESMRQRAETLIASDKSAFNISNTQLGKTTTSGTKSILEKALLNKLSYKYYNLEIPYYSIPSDDGNVRNILFYNQNADNGDGIWANNLIGNSSDSPTIGQRGHTVTSIATILSNISNGLITPDYIANRWAKNYYYNTGEADYRGGASWSMMKTIGDEFEAGAEISSINANGLLEALQDGKVVLAHGRRSTVYGNPYGNSNEYAGVNSIAIIGASEDGKKILYIDPSETSEENALKETTLKAATHYFNKGFKFGGSSSLIGINPSTIATSYDGQTVTPSTKKRSFWDNITEILTQFADVGLNMLNTRMDGREYKSIFADEYENIGNGNPLGYGGEIVNGSVYYNQADPDWKDINIGGDTIGKVGCLLSSIAMAASNATGTEITPALMASRYGSFDSSGNMYVDATLQKLMADTKVGVSWLNNFTDIKNRLSEGYPIVLYGNKGTGRIYGSGSSTHSVLGVGLTQDGKLIINDPGNSSRNSQPQTLSASSLDMGFNRFKAILFKKPDGTAPGTPNVTFTSPSSNNQSGSSWTDIITRTLGQMANLGTARMNAWSNGTDYKTELALLNAASNSSTETPTISSFTYTSDYTDLEGSTIQEKVWNYLIKQGYTPHAAAGIMGNIQQESNFNTGSIGDGGTSLGICQWHDTSNNSGRMTNLKNFAAAKGKDPTDLGVQLDFLMHEINNGYPELTAQGSKNYTAAVMAQKFCDKFERPKYPNMSARQSYATQHYSHFTSTGYGDPFFLGKGTANKSELMKELNKTNRSYGHSNSFNLNSYNTRKVGYGDYSYNNPADRPITKSDLVNKLEVALKTDGIENKLDVIIEYMAESLKQEKNTTPVSYGDINIGKGDSPTAPVIVNNNTSSEVAQPTSLRMLHDLISKGYRV